MRVSDIGSVSLHNCTFYHNTAESKGGALVTQVAHQQSWGWVEGSHELMFGQIETPDSQYVSISDTLFCFNEAPEVCRLDIVELTGQG